MNFAERRLPPEILKRASLCGNEYAWPVEDIPAVIEAARDANLLSIGGQLQFRLPDGSTFECYWVEVDTYKSVAISLAWGERVAATARVAMADFSLLLEKYDFFDEGQRHLSELFAKFAQEGHDPRDSLCFVWYVDEELTS